MSLALAVLDLCCEIWISNTSCVFLFNSIVFLPQQHLRPPPPPYRPPMPNLPRPHEYSDEEPLRAFKRPRVCIWNSYTIWNPLLIDDRCNCCNCLLFLQPPLGSLWLRVSVDVNVIAHSNFMLIFWWCSFFLVILARVCICIRWLECGIWR